MPRLTTADFAKAFDVAEPNLPPQTTDLVAAHCFDYRQLEAAERDRVMLDILRRIDGKGFTRVGAHRDVIWESAWSELRQRYHDCNRDLTSLNPSFMSAGRIVRLNGDYVEAVDQRFELSAFEVFRDWLFRTWFEPFDNVLEFGCGSGFNLAALGRIFPDKRLTGLDWSPASVVLMDEIAADHGFRLSGRRFDFFNPDTSVTLGANSAVMTFCALEQVGSRFEPFLEYLLAGRPALCVHMEPTLEHYDADHLPDYLAIRYHRHRQYLEGYLTRLRALESEGRIRIHTARRLGWGSLYQECYSLTVWEPC
jgi:Trans-aconitate methyltransferase